MESDGNPNDDDDESEAPENREGSGRFVKGISGNPGGRPKTLTEVQALAQAKTPYAIQRLIQIAKGSGGPSVRACEILLDRAWGKPVQPISGQTPDDPLVPPSAAPAAALEALRRLIAERSPPKGE